MWPKNTCSSFDWIGQSQWCSCNWLTKQLSSLLLLVRHRLLHYPCLVPLGNHRLKRADMHETLLSWLELLEPCMNCQTRELYLAPWAGSLWGAKLSGSDWVVLGNRWRQHMYLFISSYYIAASCVSCRGCRLCRFHRRDRQTFRAAQAGYPLSSCVVTVALCTSHWRVQATCKS